jgi:hypothetical protein
MTHYAITPLVTDKVVLILLLAFFTEIRRKTTRFNPVERDLIGGDAGNLWLRKDYIVVLLHLGFAS